ncbi:MAG: AMP-binding protein, partial [Chryseolinea sp.]
VWGTIEREKVNILLIVGDAFGRPLLDELERHEYDLSSLLMIVSGGAALSAPVKNALLAKLPSIAVMDGLGSSETGQQASQVTGSGTDASTGTDNQYLLTCNNIGFAKKMQCVKTTYNNGGGFIEGYTCRFDGQRLWF